MEWTESKKLWFTTKVPLNRIKSELVRIQKVSSLPVSLQIDFYRVTNVVLISLLCEMYWKKKNWNLTF